LYCATLSGLAIVCAFLPQGALLRPWAAVCNAFGVRATPSA
jgi:hypothetical protein